MWEVKSILPEDWSFLVLAILQYLEQDSEHLNLENLRKCGLEDFVIRKEACTVEKSKKDY